MYGVNNFIWFDIETTSAIPTDADKITVINFTPFLIENKDVVNIGNRRQLYIKDYPSEMHMIMDFLSKTKLGDKFTDILVGFNLSFDVNFLLYKLQQYHIKVPFDYMFLLGTKKSLDLKAFSVLYVGEYQGSTLNAITGKKGSGADAVKFYEEGKGKELLDYNYSEFVEGISLIRFLLKKLPALIDEFKNKK